MASLRSMDVKLTDVSFYAKRAHNDNFSNVYLEKIIKNFPEKRKFSIEKLLAEFVCLIYFIQDNYGLSSMKGQSQIVKQVIETFPNPSSEITEYIRKRLKSVYESLWLMPFPEEDAEPPKPRKKKSVQK